MESEIKIAWSAPRAPTFDLKEFALGILEVARENLQRDHELVPAAFIITPDEIQCVSVNFADHEEKVVIYHGLVKAAQDANAVAVITCNDALWSDNAGKDYVEAYYPGKLAAENAKECIMLTVTGPAITTWTAELPYERTNDEILFGQAREDSGGDVGFMEGWASQEPSLQ